MIDHRLHVLRMVATHGTVTAAAQTLQYTPSAVSHQLRAFGRELGVRLLVQDGRGIRLTPAARVLLSHADDLYDRWEQIRAELATAADDGGGALRLCGFSTAAAALLPQVANGVRSIRPRCTVRIIEADPEECFELLLADHADVAVVVATAGLPPTNDPRFDQQLLLQDPLDLLVPENHHLASRPSLHLAEAVDESWIMDRPGRPYHHLVLSACSSAGFTPTVAHESAEWDTGAALVAAGFGVALVPRLARIPSGYPIVRVPVRGEPTPSRTILTGVRQGSRSHPLIAAALDALTDLADRERADA